jgi:DNA-binding SARP family transcriptional activator
MEWWTPRAKLTPPHAEGLVRRRLLDVLDDRDARLCFVTAPPGSGKSTLVAQYADLASRRGHRVAWYAADAADTSAALFARRLVAAIAVAQRMEEPAAEGPDTLFALSSMLDRANVTVVVDDAHHLAGSAAERLLADAVRTSPRQVRFVVTGTRAPGVGFARHLLGAGTRTVGEADLRLRSWEIAELFDRHYAEPLPAADAVRLRHDTDGWAAGVHMFHLATAGRPLPERRRMAAGRWVDRRLVRMYFAATVFDRLPADIEDFVVGTSALGILHPSLCDMLLGRRDSAAVLEDLTERHLFTSRLDEAAGTYRYHTVLQSHLGWMLRQRLDTQQAGRLLARAAQLLEGADHPAAALRAYVRAGTLEAARRVLRTHGPRLVADPSFPDEAFTLDDPWTGIARAHRLLRTGDIPGAVGTYREVEHRAPHTAAARSARRERVSAEAWLPGAAVPAAHPGGTTWPVLLRRAVRDQSDVPSPTSSEPGVAFVAAVSALLQGEPGRALRTAVRIDAHGHGVLPLATQLVSHLATVWLGSGSVSPAALDSLAAEAERGGQPWLARLTRAASALVGAAPPVLVCCWEQCRDAEDPWGAMVVALAAGLSQLHAGLDASAMLEEAADAAHRLQAGAVEAWARALLALALARGGAATAELEARRAEACARGAGVPAARAIAFQALALAADDRAPDFRILAEASASEHGLPLARLAGRAPSGTRPEADAAEQSLDVQCFGGFRIRVGGHDLDLAPVRPRARAMLRMLACYAGQPVHEERLLDALWPAMTMAAGRRSLHVAVSGLRKTLEPAAIRGRSRLLRRTGTAYVLALPPGSRADVAEFRTAVGTWRGSASGYDDDQLRTVLRAVLASYGGELLPEDGPADWVVAEREALRADAARAAVALAELELAHLDGMAAADAAEYAIRVDPFRDQAWRALLAAQQLSGDAAATAQTRQRYSVMLGELGIAAEAATA